MDFFSNKIIENYNDYSIELENIKGIYFDPGQVMKLVYIVEGSLSYSFNGEEYRGNQGDLIFINSLENKFLISQDPKNVCLILSIKDEYLASLGELYRRAKFYNFVGQDYVLDEVVNNLIILYKINHSQEKVDVQTGQMVLNKLLKYFIKYYLCQEDSLTSCHDKVVELGLIDEVSDFKNIREMNLGYLASYTHLSKSYTSRIFNEVVGMKLVEYLQKLRLYYACVYLLNSQLNMDEIGNKVGFAYAKSLNRIFHKYLDISPKYYSRIYLDQDNEKAQQHRLELLLKMERSVDYESFISKNSPEVEINLDLDQLGTGKKIFKNLSILRNLNCLGEDYLEKLEREKDKIGLRELILRFRFKGDRLYLTDLDRELSIKELYKLLDFCLRNNIRLLIYLMDIRLDYDLSNFEENCQVYERFNDIISNGIGSNNMNKLYYMIDISESILFYKDEDRFKAYMDYIDLQKLRLEEKTGNKDFMWGYELGLVNRKRLDIFKGLYLKYGKDLRSRPQFISLRVDLPRVRLLDSVDEIGKNDRLIDSLINEVKELRDESSFPTSRVYIRGAFNHVDISYVDQGYKDLLISSLMMRRGLILRDDIRLVTDFVVRQEGLKGQLYHPKIIDEYGFYTPIYWLLNMMDKVDGEIIHMGENYVVVRNLRDIYILIYGNYQISYIYANKKGYENLDASKFNLALNIKGIYGDYKVTTEKLSFKYGNILYNLGSFNNYKYLSLDEREHLKKVSIPKFNMEIKKFDGQTRDRLDYSPFNIILRKYIKI